jgi:hypothetical protein
MIMRWRFVLVLLLGWAWGTGVALAGPAGMPDPRQMSGIPRPDPQLESGTITVRVLRGGFDRPAAEHPVSLTVRGPDGTTQTREAKTDEVKGRAVFDGLGAFVGGTAVAAVELDGEKLESQTIQLLPDAGTAVMLVAGAGPAAATAPAHGQPGGPAVPMPGTAFPLPDSPVGQLTVGTFDLAARAPIGQVDLELEITPPDGEPIVRRGTTDEQGKLVFQDLGPPEVPAGSKLVVSGTLREGGQAHRSQPFEMQESSGMAVVLAEGAEQWAAADAHAQPRPEQTRARLAGPRLLPSLPRGTVRVRLVDGRDDPVAGHEVVVFQRTAEGTGGSWRGKTGATGVAEISGVDVRGDALYRVDLQYDGAPYRSAFFGLDARGGVAVDLRVFEVTEDPSVIRSALQVDVTGLENDLAQVVHIYEALVAGDKAFWPRGGMKIPAMAGAKGLVVLRRAEPWLDHEEKADFVQLAGPLPPGELINLSFGYLVEHDGEVRFDWESPFELVESSVLVAPDQSLQATGATRGEAPPQMPDKTAWLLGPHPQGARVEFSIGGLPTTNPIFRRLGVWLAVLMGLVTLIAIVAAPRGRARDRLVRRRDELLAHLEAMGEKSDAVRRARLVAALDRVYRQLRALEAMDGGATEKAEKVQKAEKARAERSDHPE